MESPPSFCGHAEDGSKNKEFNTTIEGKSVLQSPFPFLIKVFMFLKTTLFFLFFLIVKIFWM